MDAIGLAPPDSPWEQMSVAGREFCMVGKVEPCRAGALHEPRREEYGDFDCVDCRGEEMRENRLRTRSFMYIMRPEGAAGHRGMCGHLKHHGGSMRTS